MQTKEKPERKANPVQGAIRQKRVLGQRSITRGDSAGLGFGRAGDVLGSWDRRLISRGEYEGRSVKAVSVRRSVMVIRVS